MHGFYGCHAILCFPILRKISSEIRGDSKRRKRSGRFRSIAGSIPSPRIRTLDGLPSLKLVSNSFTADQLLTVRDCHYVYGAASTPKLRDSPLATARKNHAEPHAQCYRESLASCSPEITRSPTVDRRFARQARLRLFGVRSFILIHPHPHCVCSSPCSLRIIIENEAPI